MEPRVGNKFSLGRKIGGGSFGEIYLGTNIEKMKKWLLNFFTDLLNNQQEINTQEAETHSPTNQRETRHRWSVPEENALVSAWLNTSKDAIVGNDQRGETFWNRVAAYYASSHVVYNFVMRESNTCKQKWAKINESVS